jgi:poly-gamma-glutamate synthesis protein (capsule biosynthesis protein)
MPAALAIVAGVLAGLLLGACDDDVPRRPPGQRSVGEQATPEPMERSVAPPERKPPVRFTVAVSGDLLPHLPVVARARALAGGDGYAFAPLLRELRPLIRRATLAFCHVETPLIPGPPAGYPSFRSPPELARAIRATGWDACSTASNHSLDAGQYGVGTTLRALHRAGVRATGTARSARERRRTTMLRVRGVRVAFLSYTAVSNGQAVPHPWSVNWASPGLILADARRARRRGARIVIVNLHWGTEYVQSVTPPQRELAQRLTRSPAIDAIVGQHAHVVQPIRRVNGKPVVFGEGNLISNQTAACCATAAQDGLIALIDFVVRPGRRVRAPRIRYVPTWVRHPDLTVLPAAPGSPSWNRTVSVAGRRPGIGPDEPR